MTQVIKPPNRVPVGGLGFDTPTIFLAGSIEMGKAEEWQEKATEALTGHFDFIFNPRRDDWDSSWIQSIDNPQFNEQVNWELEHIEIADWVFFYFDPNTKSPITLLELGLTVGFKSNIIVVCPDGFWRKGNVDVVCKRYCIPLFNNLQVGLDQLLKDMRG